jgi:hypothetical protein
MRGSLEMSHELGDSFSTFITICQRRINNMKKNPHMKKNSFENQVQSLVKCGGGIDKRIREGEKVICPAADMTAFE